MFCPRCGEPLTVVDREARCPSSTFSAHATAALAEVAAGPPRPATPFPAEIGGRWHCPADGARLAEVERRLRCPDCARELPARLVYELVEVNPHPATG